MTHAQAVEIILQGRGTHFDPDVVDAFVEVAEAFRETAIQFADTEEQRGMLTTGKPLSGPEPTNQNHPVPGQQA
jgi:HD-GYP domain-containing protein (c-di-GMP phosphodiesterase class II)